MPTPVPCYCHVPPTTEREMHKTVMGWLRVALPPEWIVNHQPNEGRRGWSAQRDLGDMGVMAGWPDLVLIGPGGIAYFLELKLPKGKLSPGQVEFEKKARAIECNFAVARSYQDVESALLSWGVPLSVTFETYSGAWQSKDRLTAEEYCRLILAAAPPIRQKKAKSTKNPTKRKVSHGKTSVSGKRRAA